MAEHSLFSAQEATAKLAEGSKEDIIDVLDNFCVETGLASNEERISFANTLLSSIAKLWIKTDSFIQALQQEPFSFQPSDFYFSPYLLNSGFFKVGYLIPYMRSFQREKSFHYYHVLDVQALAANEGEVVSPSYFFVEEGVNSIGFDAHYILEKLSGRYQLLAIYETDKTEQKGYLFIRNDIIPTYGRMIPPHMLPSITPFMIYNRSGVNHYYRKKSESPKFVYSCIQDVEPDHLSTIESPNDNKIKKGDTYFCINHLKGKDSVDFRFIHGDKELKSLVTREVSPIDINYNVVSSPAIIIDLDSLKVIAYVNRQDAKIPFLLDSHHISFKLTKEFMKESKEPEYRKYNKAVYRLNRMLSTLFYRHVREIQTIPGRYYHPNLDERRLFAKCHTEIALSKGLRVRTDSTDKGICLSPCGFHLQPYLQALMQYKMIEPVVTDNKEATGKYQLCNGTPMNCIVLFSYIMNSYIAERYIGEKLTDSERQEWDNRYCQNYWTNNTNLTDTNVKCHWRKGNNKTITYNSERNGGKTIEVQEIKTFRITYFARLFSLSEDSIRTLKSTATNPINVNQNNSLMSIIRCILSIPKQTD